MRPHLTQPPALLRLKNLQDVEESFQVILKYLTSLNNALETVLQLNAFEVSTLPSPSEPGQMVYVSNEAGGAVVAFSDGTNWRRVTDRAVVS